MRRLIMLCAAVAACSPPGRTVLLLGPGSADDTADAGLGTGAAQHSSGGDVATGDETVVSTGGEAALAPDAAPELWESDDAAAGGAPGYGDDAGTSTGGVTSTGGTVNTGGVPSTGGTVSTGGTTSAEQCTPVFGSNSCERCSYEYCYDADWNWWYRTSDGASFTCSESCNAASAAAWEHCCDACDSSEVACGVACTMRSASNCRWCGDVCPDGWECASVGGANWYCKDPS
jgi:hypothetical protein